jgi:hypothetical protein
MISIADEKLIPLSETPRHLPKRPNGKRLHISAIYRWIKQGVRGIRLEALRLGGTTYTSSEALQRFASQLSQVAESVPSPKPLPAASHLSRIANAARMLEVELGLTPDILKRGDSR